MRQRVLIADPDPIAREVIEAAAAEFDAEAVTAGNEDEAFKRFVEYGPEVVFADALLPRKGAFELLKRIRQTEAGGRTSIFVTSAFRAGADLRDQAMKTWGALGVLPKPLNLAAVRTELSKLLSRPESTKHAAQWLLWGTVEEEGGFDRPSFPLVFSHASRLGRPCRLAVSNGKVRKVLYFSGGNLTFAQSNMFSETLARYLLDRGEVTEAGYKAAIAKTIETGVKIGEALVALGETDPGTVDIAVRRNILEKALDIFTWDEGWYKIIPYEAPVAELPGGPIRAESVLWTAVHEQTSAEAIREALKGAAQKTLRPGRKTAELPGESIIGTLAAVLRRLVPLAEGRTIGEILEGPAQEHPDALYFLILTGFLATGSGAEEALPADPALRRRLREAQKKLSWMRGRNAFQILGVGVDADDRAVLEAFRGASAEFASDAEPPNAPERLLRVLRAVYQLMRHAFEEISTIDARRSYLSSLEGEGGAEGANALRAEADFRQGIEALRSQDWTAAFTAFSSAAAKNPEESEYYLYMGIARMHQNTPSVEAALADAEEALWRASAAAPHNAEPLFQLGKVAMKKGELERAQNLFERALRCNPQHERTLNSLAQVQTKLSKGLGSKLGSLFGGR